MNTERTANESLADTAERQAAERAAWNAMFGTAPVRVRTAPPRVSLWGAFLPCATIATGGAMLAYALSFAL